jgi:hypothetical protein
MNIRKKLKKILTDFFWDWNLINTIKIVSSNNARRETIYWIINKIEIQKTIQFLENEKDKGEKYWTLAGFIDKNLSGK